MKLKSNLRSLSVFATLTFALVACSSKPDYKRLPESANAKQEITNLEVAINNSKEEEIDLLAPESFQKAKESLSEAKRMENKDEGKRDVLDEVALGRAYLEEATKHAEKARPKLSDVIVARDAAIAAKAPELLPKDFKQLDDKVKTETTNVENKDDNEIRQKRDNFQSAYLRLELAAIKKDKIGASKDKIANAQKIGAKDLAPKTLAEATAAYKAAEMYINENRHDTTGIDQKAAAATAASDKLATTTSTARNIKTGSPEQLALDMQSKEANLNDTKDALAAESSEKAALASNNEALAAEAGALAAQNEDQKKLDETYETARTKFNPSEAEVYKQGSKLIIRLKGLEFAKSKAELKNSNFALLRKVEDVIVSFDKSNVTIEGHTDSTGGQTINKKISDERAEAVKTYLEANAKEGIAQFDSVGYGYEKPLASNKTAEGRAQNRRVDVVIDPQQM